MHHHYIQLKTQENANSSKVQLIFDNVKKFESEKLFDDKIVGKP